MILFAIERLYCKKESRTTLPDYRSNRVPIVPSLGERQEAQKGGCAEMLTELGVARIPPGSDIDLDHNDF